jgi:hypothetical protein
MQIKCDDQLEEERETCLFHSQSRYRQLDSLGRPHIEPLLSPLADWLETNPDDLGDRSIAKDIKSQLLFEFIALRSKRRCHSENRVDLIPCGWQFLHFDQGKISTAFALSRWN